MNKSPYAIADATITDLVTGKIMKVEFGHVQIIKSYSKTVGNIEKNNIKIDLTAKTYDYNFLKFKTKVFKKYLQRGYPFKLQFTGHDLTAQNIRNINHLTGEIQFLESTGKRIPYDNKFLSVKSLSNIEACERIERFR